MGKACAKPAALAQCIQAFLGMALQACRYLFAVKTRDKQGAFLQVEFAVYSQA